MQPSQPPFTTTHALVTKPRSEPPAIDYPIQVVEIDWQRLLARRPLVLNTIDHMPRYLLKPEVLRLLDAEKHPTYRLIMDIMWTTGARISEVLALKSGSFIHDNYGFGVILKTLKTRAGRPSRRELARSPKRYIPIPDPLLQDRILSYLAAGHFKARERLFPMCRQTVNRHIHQLEAKAEGTPFRVSCHTFRHSFAVHLLLHGRPLKLVGQLLGHKSIESTEVYSNVLTVDAEHFLEGVGFH